jgi:hypothetical protein
MAKRVEVVTESVAATSAPIRRKIPAASFK